MSESDQYSPLPSASSLDGVSVKTMISEGALTDRDLAVAELQLEDIKEPEEEPYRYLDMKGDREELGSVESVVSEEDVSGREEALQQLLAEEEEERITPEKLAALPVSHTQQQKQQEEEKEKQSTESASTRSELSQEDEERLATEIAEAEQLLEDDVALNLSLEAADVIRISCEPISPTAAAAAAVETALCFPKDPQVAVYWHPHCAKHYVPEHPEQPARVKVILQALRNRFLDSIAFRECRLVSEEEILLFHSAQQLQTFQRNWNTVQEAYTKRQSVIYSSLDGDTKVMWATRDAAFAAAGAVVEAIDGVLAARDDPQRVDTAFCCVRPPGHHAERNLSQGFCFFNNVGIGAKYAHIVRNIPRVAVLDFDVHHGNGTEEGLRMDEAFFYGSTHERNAYPGTGLDPSPSETKHPLFHRIVNRTISPGPKSREEFHTKWLEILDEMVLFQPELILISAGFDAHDDDELSNAEFIEDDFEWATEEILKAGLRINPQRPPKVVSVLEGGYDLNAISRSAIKHVEVLKRGYYRILEDEQLARGKDFERDFSGDAMLALEDYMKSLRV